jgi:MraZ protein
MFLGEHQHSLDSKGRITIPAKLREQLGELFVATKGLDNCIFLYPLEEWQIISGKVRALPLARADARSFERFFLSGASELEMDKQGRVVLPLNLRDYAEISKDIFIIGVGPRIEIWSDINWMEYTKQASQNFEKLAESLADLGI